MSVEAGWRVDVTPLILGLETSVHLPSRRAKSMRWLKPSVLSRITILLGRSERLVESIRCQPSVPQFGGMTPRGSCPELPGRPEKGTHVMGPTCWLCAPAMVQTRERTE